MPFHHKKHDDHAHAANDAAGSAEPATPAEPVEEAPLSAASPDAKPSPDEPLSARAFRAPKQKTPLGFKIFGALCIVGGLLLIPEIVIVLLAVGVVFAHGGLADTSATTQIIFVIALLCLAATVLAFIIFGIRLIRDKRRRARLTAEVIIVLLIADFLCDLMLGGITPNLWIYVVATAVLIATHTYIDPTLSEERELQRKLRDMETHKDAEDGTLGRDETGKGFIELDFFNLFWIFVIACVLGDAIETVYHIAVVDPGHYQVRAGMLWGPFSPIYGFGAVLMTLALNRFHKAHFIIIFLVSAIIGGAFEYLVSWFLQFAFGVTAWDYSGTFLNIGGRTNFMFMCMWGALGVVWIKLLLPVMLKVVNLIPWQWRYSITTVCAALMIVDGAMTLITLDCWYSRLAGLPNDTPLAQFCAEHFDNEWMANRFQSMSINPADSTRAH